MPEDKTPANSSPIYGASGGVANVVFQAILALSLILLVTLVLELFRSVGPSSVKLHVNLFAILSAIALVSNLAAFVLITRVRQRSQSLIWFSVFLLSVSAWAGMQSISMMSATPVEALFWYHLTTIGSVYFPVALYMFVLNYTGSKQALSTFVFPILAFVSGLFVFTDARTNLINSYTVATTKLTPWGFTVRAGTLYIALVVWVISLTLASLILLIKFRHKNSDPRILRQTKLFIIAASIPLTVGIITDGVLPVVHVTSVPPMSVILLTFTGIILSHGILKRDLFLFNPELVASQVLGTISDAVIGVSPDFRISYANKGATRMLRVTVDKLVGSSLNDFLAESDSNSQLQRDIFSSINQQDYYSIDSVNFRTGIGNTITTKLSVTKIVDKNQPYGYLVVLTDISAIAQDQAMIEQKVIARTYQLHEEQAKLRASIEGLKVGFVLADTQGKILIHNKALRSIFKLEVPPTSINQLQSHISNVDLEAKSSQVQSKRKPTIIDDVALGPKILQIFIGPVAVNEESADHLIGSVLLVDDITEAKVIERSRDEFFSIASHELRTPLTGIRGNSSMILEYYKHLLKDQQLAEMLEDIHTSSVRLIAIVNDFLDVSRIEQGKISFVFQSVDIDRVIEGVVYEMKAVLNEKKLHLAVDKLTLHTLPAVWADQNRLKQVIYNLIGNSAKYTEAGGITISAKLSADNDSVKVLVSDTGPGISPESQQLLFHKFQQAGTSLLTRDTTRGTGLGLYISKKIVEAMGGTIKLEHSVIGKGSTFSFTMPVVTPERQADVHKSRSQTDTKTGMTQNGI